MTSHNTSALARIAGASSGFALWLAGWQWSTTIGPLANVSGIPTMTATVNEALRVTDDFEFWISLKDTLTMALSGLVTAIILGISIGLGTAMYKPINDAVDPLIQFLRPLPAVVLLPLFLMVLGPTWWFGVFLAAFGAIWPILTQVQVGIRDVDPVTLDTARAMTLPWRKVQTAVVLPSAAPFILTGIRIGATSALLLAIGAGLLGGAPGLGSRILLAQEAAQSELAFGLILWSGVVGIVFAFALNSIEKAILHGRRPPEDFR